MPAPETPPAPPRWHAGLILAAAWLAVFAYGYPGILTVDSFDQLREARAGVYTDAHPPAMAALWRYLDALVAGPLLLFVLQITCFLAGIFLILRRTFAPRRAAAIAGVLTLLPPVLAPMAVVWKDALMAGFLVLGIAGLLAPGRGARLAGLAALVAASAVRYNAPAATFAVVIVLFELRPHAPTWRGRIVRYATSTAAWIAVTVAASGINGALTDRPMYFWHSSLALSDIVGTLSALDHDLPDAELRRLLAGTGVRVDTDIHAALRARSSPYDFAPLVLGDGRLWDVPIWGSTPAPAPQRAAIGRAWKEVVTTYPLAYARQRLATFAYVLGLPRHQPGVMVMGHRAQNAYLAAPLGLTLPSHRLQRTWVRAYARVAKGTPLFRPVIYLAIAFALLLLCRGHRDVFALLLSGLGAEASLLAFAITPDYRYSHWLVLCTLLAIVILTARRWHLRRPRLPRPGDRA